MNNNIRVAAEIPYAGEVPLTPNVRPVITLSGSDYDMGYQWYQQIVQIFGYGPLEERAYKKFNDQEIKALKAFHWYIRKYVPEMIALMKGMVKGANDAGVSLTYEQVLAKWAIDPIRHESEFFQKMTSCSDEEKAKRSGFATYPIPAESEDEKLPPDEDCSGFAAWGRTTKDGRLVCAGNGDHQIILGVNEINNFEYVVVMYPKVGNNLIVSTSTGGCWHSSMNNKGVVYAHHGSCGYKMRYQKPEDQNYGYGVPNTMITMHALRNANSAEAAKEILLSLPCGNGRNGGLWADVSCNAFVIENREDPRCIRISGDNGETDFIYATNNLFSKELEHCMNPPPGGNVFVPHGGWLGTKQTISSVPRNLQMWNMLHHYQGHVDIDFVKMMYRFAGGPPAYSSFEEAIENYHSSQGKGWNIRIGSLDTAMIGILKPDNDNEGLYYVSNGCPTRTESPRTPYGHYYRIDPVYSFYELKLDSSLMKLVRSAQERARFDLYYTNHELLKLNYSDCAYSPLNEKFNQAAIEWQKNEYYQYRANSTNGNESICFLGKSLRSLTRCQAIARHVYNELVPPAKNPQDLGLKPWGYWNFEKEMLLNPKSGL